MLSFFITVEPYVVGVNGEFCVKRYVAQASARNRRYRLCIRTVAVPTAKGIALKSCIFERVKVGFSCKA